MTLHFRLSEHEDGRRQAVDAVAPAERAIAAAERHNALVGHENDGFLSVSRGFLPLSSPLIALDGRFAAWDELAADLPAAYRSLCLRRRIEALPILPTTEDVLDSASVLRACALLAFLSHAYWYVDSRPPTELPRSLRAPWAELRARLGREQEVITYIDLIVYNWRIRDPALANPMVVENLNLLFPTIGNREERVFYLTQLEILAATGPIVALAATAQTAVLRDDEAALEASLHGIIACLAHVLRHSLRKIDPNPYGPTHVDPIRWAKTVAPFAVPIRAGDQGPSGTSSPIFNTLDLFFGRKVYESFLGREIKQLRATYPPAWQRYLESLTAVDVPAYIARKDSSRLRSAFREAFELYAGEAGFLGKHRMKVYGYLELAFKVGRSVTIGGFGGAFTDRTWDLVDSELSRSLAERAKGLPDFVHRARAIGAEHTDDGTAGIRLVTLDVSHAPVRYQAGARCMILPENDEAVVERTLLALDARGDELVALSDEWKAHARDRVELTARSHVPLRDLLRYGAIRAVSPRLAEALHARTQSAFLLDAIVRGKTERWELWELLELLRNGGLAPHSLWRETNGESGDQLSRLVPPQRFRVYSVSSAPRGRIQDGETSIELTVGQLRYPGPRGETSPTRRGTASSFLARAPASRSDVPFRIVHPDVFRLPEDVTTPVVLFAGGSGVAPFRAFLQERARHADAGPAVLFLSVRGPEELVYGNELATLVAAGAVSVHVAFTRRGGSFHVGDDGAAQVRPGSTLRLPDIMLRPEVAARLWQLASARDRDGGGAVFYVCGRGGFAKNVVSALETIFRERLGDAEAGAERLYRMVAEGRLLQEVHTDAQLPEDEPRTFDVSEIARHNDAEHGYWLVVDRVVYDVTRFMQMHPGGRRILQAYAGMDATHGFARAHNNRPDVDAMRETHRIGMVRTLTFDDTIARVEGPNGTVSVDCRVAYGAFVKALHLVVEMQNALVADLSLQRTRANEAIPPAERDAYRQLRSVESHRRFLKNCLAVLVDGTIPELWSLAQGLFFPEQRTPSARTVLEGARCSDAAEDVEWLALDTFERFDAWRDDGSLPAVIEASEAADVWFLRSMKAALTIAVREFEQHGVTVREYGATRLFRACQRLLGVVRQYYRRAARRSPGRSAHGTAHVEAALAPSLTLRRLHDGAHWVLEEDAAQRLVILRRSPVAALSLDALAAENERVLRCLDPSHRSFGLVVDTRHARLRNDVGFEDSMARLRHELTSHFERTAILLESRVGELQVTRIERDERRTAIATRNESTAFKFARGDG
jgi:sulfite reductase (NADPH) flavoprotein alpha-component